MSTSKVEKSSDKAGYHHGALREALVGAGLAILAEGGDPAALSLREAARRAGVSAMAPYRHFPDKEALLAAVAGVGFERLATRLREADVGQVGLEALVAQGQAYVGYALAEPALFRLMFGPALAKGDAGKSREGGPAFSVMADRVGTVVPQAEREVAALHCWAVVHGLASLALDGQIDREAAILEGLVRGVLGVTGRGLAALSSGQNGTGVPSQAKKPPLSAG